jgi:glycogen debranching enzyme
MEPTPQPIRPVLQVLDFGGIRQERASAPDTMFLNSGRRIYVIGDIDGRFRPRTNPYDLYAFGGPHPEDVLAEKLQGVWAQPVKGFSRYSFAVETGGETWDLDEAEHFTQAVTHASFDFRRAGLYASRRDFAALDLPVLFSSLYLENESEQSQHVRLIFRAHFDLEDAWFTQLGEARNAGENAAVEDGLLVARSQVLPEEWAAAAGCDVPTTAVHVLDGGVGEMVFDLALAPGEARVLTFALAVASQGGAAAARKLIQEALPRFETLLADKQAAYQRVLDNGPRLHSPNEELNTAFRLSLANLQMLEAENEGLGRYFFAGIEIFPFWFSNDGAYSGPGLLAGGFRESFLNHVRIGQHFQVEGRVPHQISPSAKTAFAGNAQETALWVMSVWDAFRWTGDRAFLQEVYPGAVLGLLDYTLGTIDPDGDGYPSGPGMVEAEGMGEEKLDSAAYAWAALKALAEMAAVLEDQPVWERALAWIDKIEANFEADWWDEPLGTYAMSLLQDNQRYPVPHWAVVVPLEVGLASPEHAAATFATLRAGYLNEWGLKHTAGEDERVWTLPTATLSRAAYRYGERGLGFEMLHHVAETLRHGSTGMFHELIPEGACFIQLWSAATLIRGVVEDLLGIEVRADRGEIRAAPRLPADWQSARLENLSFGAWVVNVEVWQDGSVKVEQVQGPKPVEVLEN